MARFRHHYPQLQRPRGADSSRSAPVELHHSLGHGLSRKLLSGEDLLRGSSLKEWIGVRIRVPSPEHLVTHLILHAQLHHCYSERIWPPLRAMNDLAMVARPPLRVAPRLGGRPATSPEEMRRVVGVLTEAMRNVMRHYGMIAGEAHYSEKRWKGVQEALLAPASGVFVPAEGVACKKPMQKGEPIATIVDVWGDVQGTLTAPADGMIFGLRALPNVMTGEWCCFYGKTNGFRD